MGPSRMKAKESSLLLDVKLESMRFEGINFIYQGIDPKDKEHFLVEGCRSDSEFAQICQQIILRISRKYDVQTINSMRRSLNVQLDFKTKSFSNKKFFKKKYGFLLKKLEMKTYIEMRLNMKF